MSLGAFLAAYSIRWRIEVMGEDLTVHRLFGKPLSFTFGDITRIKYGSRITAYIDDKKVLSMDQRAIGATVLYFQLRELRKIDGLRDKDDFAAEIPKWVVVLFMFLSIRTLRSRITVYKDSIIIRKVFSESVYSFGDITRVDVDIFNHISIYILKLRT